MTVFLDDEQLAPVPYSFPTDREWKPSIGLSSQTAMHSNSA